MLDIFKSIKDHSTVFQAKFIAVTIAVCDAAMMTILRDEITFFTDTQAAIKAISAIELKLKLLERSTNSVEKFNELVRNDFAMNLFT